MYKGTDQAAELWFTENKDKINEYACAFKAIFPKNPYYLRVCILPVPHHPNNCIIPTIDSYHRMVCIESGYSDCLHPIPPCIYGADK